MENGMSLDKHKEWVEDYLEATEDARAMSEQCRDYFDHKQWSQEEIDTLNRRKQPIITVNRIKPKVQFLTGLESQTRTDPKAYPRNPADEGTAEAATDSIRYVADNNDLNMAFTDGFEDFLIEGVEGYEVIAKEKKGSFDIIVNKLDWDRLFYDPHSRARDFSDARYLGTVQWMDVSEFKELWPDAPADVFDFTEGSGDNTLDDTPKVWVDAKRKRVRVVYLYFIKNAVWHYCIYTGGGYVKEPEVSAYVNDLGEPDCQFVFQSAFVDRDGNRYGEVKSYIDIQDEINKRRSKALHLVSVRQTWGNKGAVPDPSAIKAELAKPDGHVEIKHGEFGKDFGVLPTGDMAMSQFSLLEEAKAEIDAVGANAALAGKDDRSLSGRAQQMRAQGGITELGRLFDSHRHCKKRVYRKIWTRIKQFWNDEKWIRITDDEKNLKFVGLNRPVTMREALIQEMGGIPPEIEGDPRLNAIVGIENNTSDMDVDIIIDEAPDTITLQQEQFELLVSIFQANPQAIPFEMIIEASQLRNKDKIIEKLQGGSPEENKR